MRRIFWKASLAGAVLVVTTVYVAAQMGPGQMPQRPMPREHMMEMMKHMSQMMATGCTIDSRKGRPNTYQLIQNPQLIRGLG